MIQELLAQPPRLESMANLFAWVLAAAGLGLWLFGARCNRALMCLGGVGAGAVVGMHLPHWFGWTFEPWAAALGLAAVLGILGFAMHRVWAGLALAGLLALWGALVTWVHYHGANTLQWPAWQPGTPLATYGKSIWNALPEDVRGVLPLACSVAAAAGLVLAIIKPRFAMLLLHSALGVTLMVLLGLLAVKNSRPDWLHSLPQRDATQAGILVGLVLFGMLWQKWTGPGRKSGASGSSKKSSPRNRPSLE
jgi:hypothetical protein